MHEWEDIGNYSYSMVRNLWLKINFESIKHQGEPSSASNLCANFQAEVVSFMDLDFELNERQKVQLIRNLTHQLDSIHWPSVSNLGYRFK